MTDRIPLRRALLGVYDKTGIEELAAGLAAAGVELVSTGATARRIAEAGVDTATHAIGDAAVAHVVRSLAGVGGGATHRVEHLETMPGELVHRFAASGLVNVVGGCCGTTAEHIAALAEAARRGAPRKLPGSEGRTVLAGLEPMILAA